MSKGPRTEFAIVTHQSTHSYTFFFLVHRWLPFGIL